MEINWDDESEQTSAPIEREEEVAAPPTEQPTASAPPATAKRKVAADRHGFYMTYISALAGVLLVVAIAGVGFVFGHYVVKPTASIIQSPSYARRTCRRSGSGGFEIPNFGGDQTVASPVIRLSGPLEQHDERSGGGEDREER